MILGNEWFPLAMEETDEIFTELDNINIPSTGQITLRQCLQLARSTSSLVRVEQSTDNDGEAILEPIEHLGINATLYPYQEKGVSWLAEIAKEEIGCVLADEMGLGKTLQIIALISHSGSLGPISALVVSPATLLENWRREIAKFAPHLSVLVHSGQRRTGFYSNLQKYDVVITSYDTAVRDQSMFGMIEWRFMILDEAQAIKNPDTRRAVAIKKLSRKVSIAVTGTPVENRLRDLWSIMDFSCSGLLGTCAEFEASFDDCNADAERLEKLVSPLVLRRRVVEVAGDLPDRIIIPQPIPLSPKQVEEYEELRESIAEEYGRSATLVSLIRLRQYCTHPNLITKRDDDPLRSTKYGRLTEILEEIRESDEKAIIFTSYTKMADMLASDLSERFSVPCMVIDGRTPVEDRQPTVDDFGKCPSSAILILNPRAAGTGLNITAANHVIHYNLEWNPAVEDQATARAYRRGQELPVTVHRLFHPGTVEEVIDDRLARKRGLAEAAVVGTEGKGMELADIARAMTISPTTLNGEENHG